MNFLARNSHPGDVVLPGGNLLGPVCALTRCRVPIGYCPPRRSPRRTTKRGRSWQARFWKDWRSGKIKGEFLGTTHVRYITVRKQLEGFSTDPPTVRSSGARDS